MKATYLKPTIGYIEVTLFAILITASANGERLLGEGGNASDGSVTTSDSRRLWDDDEDEDDDF
jgi:hypothetical protein